MNPRPKPRLPIFGLILPVLVLALLLVSGLIAASAQGLYDTYLPIVFGPGAPPANFVLLGWNDLGMHCYNYKF